MTEENRLDNLEKRVIDLEKSVAKMEVRIDGLNGLLENLRKKLEEGFNDISSKIIKGMGFIIGILLSITGLMIYTYIMK
jgi:tetrahydromethanopterin S-methyltransferase subunit G